MHHRISKGTGRKLAALSLIIVLVPSLFAGCLSDGNGDTGTVTITLNAPFMDSRSNEGGNVWDATLDIYMIIPGDAVVKWVHVSVAIKSFTGTVLLGATPVSKDGGLYGSAVEVWYVDEAGARDQADEGDAVKVTTMDQTYQGAQVTIYYRGERVASSNLPANFP